MKPRVLQVITVKMGYEGITMSVMRFMRHMPGVRCEIAAIAEPPAALRNELAELGCLVHVMPPRLKSPVRYMIELTKLIRREKFDIVHVHGNSCTLAIDLMAAYLGGAKVRAAHSHNSMCKFLKLHKLLRPAFDCLYTHAWACGQEAGQWLFRNRPFNVARVSTETARYAFDPEVRRRARADMKLEGRLAIGSVANFNEQKNHKFMLEVFAEYLKHDPSAALVLVGNGPLMEEVSARARELGVSESVIMLGVRSDVPELIQAMDIMLLPSLHEGFPGVLMEWQCAGLRALVSDRVTRDTDLTGLLSFLPIEITEPWVQALRNFEPDPDRAATSEKAVQMICDKGYDIARNAKMLEKFYMDCR